MNKPPTSVAVYDFSYSRSTGKMRFRLDEDAWLVKQFAGRWEVVDTLRHGNLLVRCKLAVEDEVGSVWLPKDSPVEEYAAECPEGSTSTHWRLCYNREDSMRDIKPHFRIRDEVTGILHSNDITAYRGVMNVNYFDGGPHIFTDGPAHIDMEGVAHFALG